MVHHTFAGGLDFARSNLPTASDVLLIIQAMLVVPHAVRELPVSLVGFGGAGRQVQGYQFG